MLVHFHCDIPKDVGSHDLRKIYVIIKKYFLNKSINPIQTNIPSYLNDFQYFAAIFRNTGQYWNTGSFPNFTSNIKWIWSSNVKFINSLNIWSKIWIWSLKGKIGMKLVGFGLPGLSYLKHIKQITLTFCDILKLLFSFSTLPTCSSEPQLIKMKRKLRLSCIGITKFSGCMYHTKLLQ